jgi:hypothetical protein
MPVNGGKTRVAISYPLPLWITCGDVVSIVFILLKINKLLNVFAAAFLSMSDMVKLKRKIGTCKFFVDFFTPQITYRTTTSAT